MPVTGTDLEPGQLDLLHSGMPEKEESSRPISVPVLVVGAGPAGLVAAAELGQRGIRCIVIEPRSEVSHERPRAKTTSARTMEHLRRLGIAESLRAAAPLKVEWSQRVTFCQSLSGPSIVGFDGAFGLGDDCLAVCSERGQQVAQPVFEEVLRSHLQTLPSVEVRLGDRVRSIETSDEKTTAFVETPSGDTYEVTARYLLGCDGSSGAVRQALGVEYVGRSEALTNFNVVFHAPGLSTPLNPAVQYWAVGAPAPGLIGRLDMEGTWWAIFPGLGGDHDLSCIRELLFGLVGRKFDFSVVATDTWSARMMVADRFKVGSVFLVGDSCHLNPPWGGHGYNTAIGDAVNIAWKIAAVEQGWAGPAILDSYEAERRPVVAQTVELSERNMSSVPGRLPTDAASIVAAKSGEFYSLGLVLGYSYQGSPIVQPQFAGETEQDADSTSYLPTTTPGARLPHHWLSDGSSLYDRLGKSLSLLIPPGRDAEALGFVERSRDNGIPISVVELPADYPWPTEFLLVRPDHHIAWRGEHIVDIDLDLVLGCQPVALTEHA